MTDELSFKTSMAFAYGAPAPMAPGIVRLVANNPSVLTFKGTNTYLVGMTSLAVIDPGPDDAAHCEAIVKTAGRRPITHIFLTHAHRDHADALARLKELTGAATCCFPRSAAPADTSAASPSGREYVNYDVRPDIALGPGDTVAGRDWALTAIHTPGHAPDHLCFTLEGRDVVFSGDHVMAWNTSIVAPPEGRMSDYLRSLEILLDRHDRLFMPGHGGRLEEPQRTVRAYLLHRRWREQAILTAIRNGERTIRTIVPVVYGGIDERLAAAAVLSVQAHVEHLIERGLVTCEHPPTFDRPLHPA